MFRIEFIIIRITLINISINQGDAYNGRTFIMRCIELYKRYTKWGA